VLASAPGRINLLGEHTDYNGGLVLPFAIQRRTLVAVAAAGEWEAVSCSDGLVRSFDPKGARPADWTAYPWGVARVLAAAGVILPGVRLAVASSVPIGAGLSSSAALTLSTAKALCLLAGRKLSASDLAEVAWRAEHDEVGVHCGRMDQTIGALATRGSALLIETGSGRVERVPFRETVWVLETGVFHHLDTSPYHRRRRECEEALAFCRDQGFRLGGLAELTPVDLPEVVRFLPPPLGARVRHVVMETERTREAARALRRGDLDQLGRLMVAGHYSLRDDYQSTCVPARRLISWWMPRCATARAGRGSPGQGGEGRSSPCCRPGGSQGLSPESARNSERRRGGIWWSGPRTLGAA